MPTIELNLGTTDRLFHELDPSPLLGRDLDEGVGAQETYPFGL